MATFRDNNGFIGPRPNYTTGSVHHDRQYLENTINSWPSTFGPIEPLENRLASLSSSLAIYGETDVASIINTIEENGFTTIMTPTHGAMAELMVGQNTKLSSSGRFRYDLFDSPRSLLSSKTNTGDFNNLPYLVYAGFANGSFYGFAVSFYRDYTDEARLKDLFEPNQNRNLFAYIRNADGTERLDTSGTTGTIFSDGQSPNGNGYHTTTEFSADDGSHGFAIGTIALDGNGGPYLGSNIPNAYGCENANSNDFSADDFYWGQQINTTTYVFVVFSEFA